VAPDAVDEFADADRASTAQQEYREHGPLLR
jgi:hypothetical protein